MTLRLRKTLLCLAAFSTVVHGAVQTYSIDPTQAKIGFTVKNFTVNTVRGKFETFSGEIRYDPDHVEQSSARVTIQTRSIQTGNRKRDSHLRSREFFDVERYPEMTFYSERVEKEGTTLIMTGPLTLRGQTHPVRVTVTLARPSSERPFEADATSELRRGDFGIDYGNGFSISQKVSIQIHVGARGEMAQIQIP